MADIITGTTTGFVNNLPDNTFNAISDVRREAAEHTNEIVRESLKGDYNTASSVKDARFDINSRVEGVHQSMSDRFFAIGRDLADVRAQLVQAIQSSANASEINALKTQLAIKEDGEKTRAVIAANNNEALNRMLIERNAEIVEERHHARHWRGHYDQGQWAALNSQLQAFQSSLAETRQGMVNFGTMAGVGQTSTTNQV